MKYVLPTRRISASAADVTKITIKDGEMFHSGKRVNAVSYREAFDGFDRFISSLGPAVVLVAHNGHKFDFPR